MWQGRKREGEGGAGGWHFRIFAAIRDVDHTAYLPRVSSVGSYSRKQRQLQIKYTALRHLKQKLFWVDELKKVMNNGTYPFTYMANKIGDFYKKGW